MEGNRCLADLGRVNPQFCIGDEHRSDHGDPAATLSYEWVLNDDVFDLKARSCLGDGGTPGRQMDLVLALDRSQNIWKTDIRRRKFGIDNLAGARRLIEKLNEDHPNTKVGLVLFSSTKTCQVYDGGPINMGQAFPCLYLPAKTLADTAHRDRLHELLDSANGLYSDSSPARASDYEIVANLLKQQVMGIDGVGGLVMFSDGFSMDGESDNAFRYLQKKSYQMAQSRIIKAFDDVALKTYEMAFALNPVKDPAFDTIYSDLYDNMCESHRADYVDCNEGEVNHLDPATWPVNKINRRSYAVDLVQQLGGDEHNVILLDQLSSVDSLVEMMRHEQGATRISAVRMSTDGAPEQYGEITTDGFYLRDLPSGKDMNLEIFLDTDQGTMQVPVAIKAIQSENQFKDFEDREMLCRAALEPEIVDPAVSLKNLQGGSASCGVVGSARIFSVWWMLLPLLIPLGIGLRRSGTGSGSNLLVLVVIFLAFAGSSDAQAEPQGLNAQHYQPVVGGTGLTEDAKVLAPGAFNMGLFTSYANDPVEVGGDKNKRAESVMDDVVTAHAVGNIGVFHKVSFGFHVPYVHKSDVDRSVEGETYAGGLLGRPSDVAVSVKVELGSYKGYQLAVSPMVTIPTGSPEHLLGDGSTNYGALMIVSARVGALKWAYNGGYLQRQEPVILKDDRTRPVVVRGQILNYGGIAYRYDSLWTFGGRLQWKISAGEAWDFLPTNPAEWAAIVEATPLSFLKMTGGLGTGIGKGYGSPDYRVFAGISYEPGARDSRPGGRIMAKRK